MDTNRLNEYLLELVQETSLELLKIYFKKEARNTLLRFPKYRNGEIRVSEQELRFAMTNLHGKFNYLDLTYSVETPTELDYSFSDQSVGKRSASSDLSFYSNDEKVLNIELKAHNAEQAAIDKDIEKLTCENCNGAWIHILKSEDKGTVESLFKKFKNAFHKYGPSKKPISFHILILDTKTLLSRKGKIGETDYTRNIFNIDYNLWKDLQKKPGKYQFYDGCNPITVNHLDVDWQIDIFDI